MIVLKYFAGSWRNGSVVEGASHSFRGPGFTSQHPHDKSTAPNSSSRDSNALSGFLQLLHAHGAHINAGNTLIHRKPKIFGKYFWDINIIFASCSLTYIINT